MFDNIASLNLVKVGCSSDVYATAMVSSEGEVMTLRETVAAEGRVEDWMTRVLEEMRRTNRLLTKEAIFHYCHQMTRLYYYRYTHAYIYYCHQVTLLQIYTHAYM